MMKKWYKYLILLLIVTFAGLTLMKNKSYNSKDDVYDCRNYVSTLYHDMQLRFNIPMYIAILKTSNYSHCINCVLIGDSVLKFSDWKFVEAQNDFMFDSGKPSIPNSTISIVAPKRLSSERFDKFDIIEIIRFKFDNESSVSVDYYHPELILSREEALTKNIVHLADSAKNEDDSYK